MNDDILKYYERELTYIRELGAEFARKYPKVAGRLLLEPDKCEDPHTERLIEAFAFLSGRIHKKIDDDFPEITESLLSVLYPHYISPVPSMSVVTFDPVKQAIPPSGYRIEKNKTLYSKPVGGVPCQFVTTYPVTLWPIEILSAGLRDTKKTVKNARQAIVIQVKTANNISLSKLGWEELRFFLNGQGQHVYHLYELLFNNVCHVECELVSRQGKKETIVLAPENIKPVGFRTDEGMMPYPQRSFSGYLLLFEYFCFPEKFLFFDLGGLGSIKQRDVTDTMDIWIYLDRIAKPDLLLDKSTFSLYTTPVINIFKRIAEPIRVEEEKTEYHVIPDIRRSEATEVFSIDSVMAATPDASEKERELRPFYSMKRHVNEDYDEQKAAFWHVRRRPSAKKGDDGTEVFLSFSDGNFRSTNADVETITVNISCTNRDLPAKLPFGDPAGDFEMETAAPVARISCIVKPTPTRRPALGGAMQWRLLSHLSLNYLSLVQGGEETLKEILRLYDFDNSPSTRQQINGIASVQSAPITRRIGRSFCRGIQIAIEFDEDKYVGTGLYLLASVLEQFLGQYVSVNSFSQLVARTSQRKERLSTWPPRSGNRMLI